MKNGKIAFTGVMVLTLLFTVLFIIPERTEAKTNEATIQIEYSGSWSGSIGGDNSRSVDGTGSETYTVEGDIIVATIQKDDDSSDELTVSIMVEGKTEETESTTASYGVVTVSYSFPVEEWEEVEDNGCMTISAILIAITIALIFIYSFTRERSK